jgi:outer membrane lipoprotein-sorting protein
MKSILIYTLLIMVITANAFAQKDAQAKTILNPVSQKYRSYSTLKSDFSFTLDNSQAGIKATQNGTLVTQPKTNKYKITLYTPGGEKAEVEQEIISDGKSQWTYIKKDKEVELTTADHSSTGFNPAQIFTVYEHGYKYI